MKKEEKKFVESLNKDKIKGHEVDSLRYNRDGTWAFVVLCSCGSLHPIGGVDDKFVLWSINVIEEKSWETFTKDDLPSLSWEYNYRGIFEKNQSGSILRYPVVKSQQGIFIFDAEKLIKALISNSHKKIFELAWLGAKSFQK